MSDVTIDDWGDHVALVCLHRAPNNFFDTVLLDEIAGAYEELATTRWCRAIVIAAEGKHFCAGLDFAHNADQDIAALYANAARLFATPLPVVAAVNGSAIGGGLGLALSADFRVAAPSSRFSANFARLRVSSRLRADGHLAVGGRTPKSSRIALQRPPDRWGRGVGARTV